MNCLRLSDPESVTCACRRSGYVLLSEVGPRLKRRHYYNATRAEISERLARTFNLQRQTLKHPCRSASAWVSPLSVEY